MTNLTTLHLAGNALTGPLPAHLPHDSSLTDLSISHNALTGIISTDLQTRPWTTLDLSFNRFTGGISRHFATQSNNFSAAVTYALQNNRLSGKLPGSLQGVVNISVLGSNMFSCKVDKSDLPQHDNEIDTYSCGSDSFNYSYITLIGVLLVGAALVLGSLYYSATTARAPLVEKALNSLAKWSVDAYPDLTHFRQVCASGDFLCNIGMLSTVVIILVLLPWYVSASRFYGTYTHTYAWVLSAAFLTGSTPAYVELALFMALMLFVSASSRLLVLRLDAAQRPISMRPAARASVQLVSMRVGLPARIGIYVAFLCANLTIVIGMNVAFVVMVLSQSNFVQFLAQVLLGAFKLVWNTVCTPYLINACAMYISGTTYHDAAFTTIQVLIALLNNIAIPCLVVALISPSCFYSVFDPPPPVVSSFTYETTSRPGLGLTNRDLFKVSTVEVVSYAPPFAYDYQCSSSLITYYAPAFVYLAIGAALASPAAWTALVQWHKRATPGTLWYRAVDAVLCDIWKPVSAMIDPPSYLFEVNLHFVNLITYLGILLTFGVVFPPVAVAMCATMLSVNWQVKLYVGRFLYAAKKAQGLRLIHLVEEECKGAVSLVKLRRSLFLTICFACSFVAFFIFDTLGDTEGFSASAPVLVVMAIFPIVIYFLTWVHKRVTATGKGGSTSEVNGRKEPELAVEMELTGLSRTGGAHTRGRADLAGAEHDQESGEVVNVLIES
jgi:hypothetical protein